MKKTLLYGKAERAYPWSDGFSVKSDGTIHSKISGINQLLFEDNEDITWSSLFHSELSILATSEEILKTESNSVLGGDILLVYDTYISRLWDKLESYCNSRSRVEKDFLVLYIRMCCNKDLHQGALHPAMIPNVYINWDFSKEERGKSVKPYIVDFAFKSSMFGTNSLTIVEIDGLSHYADYDSSNKYILSENRYADHLKKDRWLRSQGFNVFRIGNSEIKAITSLPKDKQDEAFYHFFRDVFGDGISMRW